MRKYQTKVATVFVTPSLQPVNRNGSQHKRARVIYSWASDARQASTVADQPDGYAAEQPLSMKRTDQWFLWYLVKADRWTATLFVKSPNLVTFVRPTAQLDMDLSVKLPPSLRCKPLLPAITRKLPHKKPSTILLWTSRIPGILHTHRVRNKIWQRGRMLFTRMALRRTQLHSVRLYLQIPRKWRPSKQTRKCQKWLREKILTHFSSFLNPYTRYFSVLYMQRTCARCAQARVTPLEKLCNIVLEFLRYQQGGPMRVVYKSWGVVW